MLQREISIENLRAAHKFMFIDTESLFLENAVLRVFLSITFNTLFFGTCQNVLIEVLIESVLIEMEDLANSLTHRIITPF